MMVRMSALMFLYLAFMLPAHSAQSCLELSNKRYWIRGTLVADKERSYFLVPDEPFCAIDKSYDPPNRHQNVARLHLLVTVGYDAMRPNLGRPVELHGSLFEGITAHHKTPVMLEVFAVKSLYQGP